MADNSEFIRTLLEKTDEEFAEKSDAGWVTAEFKKRGDLVAIFRRYSEGDHDAEYTDEMKEMLRIADDDSPLNKFIANYIQIIIDKMANRIEIAGFQLGSEIANEWWQGVLDRSKFRASVSMLHRGAVRDGISFAMVDPITASFRAEPAYDGHSGVVALFDEHDDIRWAAKIWTEASKENTISIGDDAEDMPEAQTLYGIVYQKEKMTAWMLTDEEEAELTPYKFWNENTASEVAWDHPKVPVHMFVNKRDNYSYYGESEIQPAIPLQNILNRTLHSTAMVEELGAFPVNVIIGAALEIGAIVPGSVVCLPLKDVDGNVVTKADEDSARLLNAIKHFTMKPAELSAYLNAIEKFVVQLSHTTQTPFYGLTTSGNISGEALKQLEIGLVGKCIRFQNENTDVWREIIYQIRDLTTTYGDIQAAPMFDVATVSWMSPEIRERNDDIELLLSIQERSPDLFPIIFYRERIGALLDLSKHEIDAYGKLADVEAKQRMLDAASMAGDTEFDLGGADDVDEEEEAVEVDDAE